MEHLEGYVEHIVYRNEENGYTVLSLMPMRGGTEEKKTAAGRKTAGGRKGGGGEITCVGSFQALHEGEYLSAEGDYTEHPVYGKQFQVRECESRVPRSGVALERYLGSGAVKGIGPRLAERIVRAFDEDTLRILEEEPERLAEIKGISMRMAREIGEQVREKSQMQNALIFLAQYGISMPLGIKIYQKYQDDLYRVLKENPYRMAEDIRGVGFRTADEIASRIGIRVDSEYRIRSGICYILSMAEGQGHVCLPKDLLLQRTGELLGLDAEDLEKYLMDLMIDRRLVLKTEGEAEEENCLVYNSHMYSMELNTARMLQDLNIRCQTGEQGILAQIARIEKKEKISLDEKQRQAVLSAASNGLMILTGGPGTGKTTTINTMIRYFLAENMEIALAAPTGRAAKRMTEMTGYEASTIHRLLELNGVVEEDREEVRFERNADNPLEADVVIIDEMSMVDIHLMHALLSAVVPGTRLIMVGDVNQLPSVGPGCVLRDLIRSASFPVTELTHIFRQASESDIVVNAHRINAGQEIRLDNQSRDFFFLQRNEVYDIQHILVYLTSHKLPEYVHADPMEVQVLTPMRKGALGVENLNRILQKYLNPQDPEKEEKEIGGQLFREGDKVMQVRNDYQLEWKILGEYQIPVQQGMGIFNGEMGRIRSIYPAEEMLEVEFEEGKLVEYSFRQLDELELAYAITIHKSQGSEYPAVILPLLGGPRMLMNRNLLYTAVTRARRCVMLVGSQDTVSEMIRNHTETGRYTTLARRIREMREADGR